MYKGYGHIVKKGMEAKFFTTLSKGRKISRKQAKAWWGLRNPSSCVLRFEQAGFNVTRLYTKKRNQKYPTVTYSL